MSGNPLLNEAAWPRAQWPHADRAYTRLKAYHRLSDRRRSAGCAGDNGAGNYQTKTQSHLGCFHLRGRWIFVRQPLKTATAYCSLERHSRGSLAERSLAFRIKGSRGDYLRRLETSDVAEQAAGGSRVKNLAKKIAAIRDRRTRCQGMLVELDRTGEDQISLTDPDSRAMAAHTHLAVGYNVQVAADTKHKLIVEQRTKS